MLRLNGFYFQLVLLLCLCTTNCEKEEVEPVEPTRKEEVPGAGQPDEPFIYARTAKTAANVPARFKAGLPTSLAEFQGDWSRFPPRSLIDASLCAGDPDMQSRYLDAVRKASAAGPMAPDLLRAFEGLLGYCGTDAKCAWLSGQIRAEKSAAVRQVLYAGLVHCNSSKYRELFERAHAPSGAIIDWYFLATGKPAGEWNSHLERAAREVATSGKRYEVRKVGVVLGRFPGSRPLKLIEQLQKSLENPEHRALLAIGLKKNQHPKARALYSKACKHPSLANEPMCKPPGRVPAAHGPKAVRSIAERVRAYETDIRSLAAQAPGNRKKAMDALVGCLSDPQTEEYIRSTCLERLAILDRARAVAEISKVDPSTWSADRSRALVSVLLNFPKEGALQRELTRLGLLSDRARNPNQGAHGDLSLLPRELLEARGRAMSFDTETDMFPNQHDKLLRKLAALASPALDGIVFEEVPPSDHEDQGPYHLRAYMDGHRHEVAAENLGDWYDLQAVLGLLNSLARERGRKERFVNLPTGDQTATVLAGPGKGIITAARRGLIQLAGAHDGMRAGKVFEQRVFEQLRREGKAVQQDVVVPTGSSGASIDNIVDE